MKNKLLILLLLPALFAIAQNTTFSPYSRYGLGELSPSTFAHNQGMGGAHIALKPDSTMPVFINAGNPASYALTRLTALEVGGVYNYIRFHTGGTSLDKWNTNFLYGALAFPMGKRAGGTLGIRPFSLVGYDAQLNSNEEGIGSVKYLYNGNGGLTKAYVGYGIMPFKDRLRRFRTKNMVRPEDSTVAPLSGSKYLVGEQLSKFLSDLSMGFHVDYIFGNIVNTTKVVYPSSVLYNNSYRLRELYVADFTGNFGLQSALTFDSVRAGGRRRVLNEKVKITMGYYMNLVNPLKSTYNSAVYNYILNSSGQEILRDTAFISEQKTKVTLPGEQGFGIGFKKGEKLNILADFAITGWQNFKFLESPAGLKNSSRIALGADFVPEKYAFGRNAFWRRVHYRMGVNYQTGYISLNNNTISDYSVSFGVGLPVGINRLSSMVNISARYGRMGGTDSRLTSENYFRVYFGFTFSDRWFQKYRYD